eukprot:COSAG06_NODE_3248_length_5619_cov_32.539493_3_plen_62_part_00
MSFVPREGCCEIWHRITGVKLSLAPMDDVTDDWRLTPQGRHDRVTSLLQTVEMNLRRWSSS